MISRKKNPKLYARVKNNRFQAQRKKNINNYRRKKMKFQSARRPFVEIKGRSHRELWQTMGGHPDNYPTLDTIVDPTTVINLVTGGSSSPASRMRMLPLWSYLNPVQGVTDNDIIGTSMTAKFLTAKVQFYFPTTPQLTSPRYYIVHGWVKVPVHNTAYTVPSRTDFTRQQLLTHIQNHVKNFFDQDGKDEFLQFKEKSNKDFITLGYKRITTNRNINPGVNPTNSGYIGAESLKGSNPVQTIVCKWPMNNRKIKYIYGTQNAVHGTPGTPFLYENTQWLPFLLYYCPDKDVVPAGSTNSPALAYNNKIWFSDS